MGQTNKQTNKQREVLSTGLLNDRQRWEGLGRFQVDSRPIKGDAAAISI